MSYTLPGVDLEPFFDGVQVAVDTLGSSGAPASCSPRAWVSRG